MLEPLLQLFFPHLCACCGISLHWHEQSCCYSCLKQLPFTDFFDIPNNQVEHLFTGRITVTAASLLYFESKYTQLMLHLFKYKKRKSIGVLIGQLIAESINNSKRFQSIDLIIPVPLHPRKEKIRGYNQSWIIAKTIGQQLNIQAKNNLLVRNTFTDTQTKKDRLNRWKNVDNKFSTTKDEQLSGKHVLLIDDVVTTGATAEACLQTLKNVNCQSLYFVSAASA